MVSDNWATFVASCAGHFRLTATLASAHCATSLPKLAQIRFNVPGPHLITPWLAFVDCATFLPKVDHICLALFGPYLLFNKWATLGSHSDTTFPWTPHLCLQRRICDLIHLGLFCYFICGPRQAYLHFERAIRRLAVLVAHIRMLSGI